MVLEWRSIDNNQFHCYCGCYRPFLFASLVLRYLSFGQCWLRCAVTLWLLPSSINQLVCVSSVTAYLLDGFIEKLIQLKSDWMQIAARVWAAGGRAVATAGRCIRPIRRAVQRRRPRASASVLAWTTASPASLLPPTAWPLAATAAGPAMATPSPGSPRTEGNSSRSVKSTQLTKSHREKLVSSIKSGFGNPLMINK